MRNEAFMEHLKECELKSLHEVMTHDELRHFATAIMRVHKWKQITYCPYCGQRLKLKQ